MYIRITAPPVQKSEDISNYVSFHEKQRNIIIRKNNSIQQDDSFFLKKTRFSFQYENRSDFCKNILISIPDRKCTHIVSYDELTAEKLKEILEETNSESNNIIYYKWSSGRKPLLHVSVIYIDKKEQKIYYMPDTFLSRINSYAPLIDQLRQETGYQICIPVSSYFLSQKATIQEDEISCSFISNQIAQKLEKMNQIDSPEFKFITIPNLADLIPKSAEISLIKHGHLVSTSIQIDEQILALPFSPFVYPDMFAGISQRLAPIKVNEYVLNLIQQRNPKSNTPNPQSDTKEKRTLWIRYFGFLFENKVSGDGSKYAEMERLLTDKRAYMPVYAKKTSPFRKVWDLKLINPENAEYAIEIAKNVFKVFKLSPTDEFFESIGVTEGEKRASILDSITSG